MFQFTHPGKGATSFAGESPPYPQSFNSRTLGRVRPDVLKAVVPATKVSIHAPWEGCDMVRSSTTTLSMSFNSRTLGRVRQTPCNHLCKRPLFQFTHPGKGATLVGLCGTIDAYVSIHAPWEGCDNLDTDYYAAIVEVSIHAPWEGCDNTQDKSFLNMDVSIHAPWEGCDGQTFSLVAALNEFQFTHPGKGATHLAEEIAKDEAKFQFTHPGKGATGSSRTPQVMLTSFNSRTLGRVRPFIFNRAGVYLPVSIHAPWEGCDVKISLQSSSTSSFNSRTLGRVRRGGGEILDRIYMFQFTHPGKGATIAK